MVSGFLSLVIRNDITGNRTYQMDTIGKSDSSIAYLMTWCLKILKQCGESDNDYRIMEWLDNMINWRLYMVPLINISGIFLCKKIYICKVLT